MNIIGYLPPDRLRLKRARSDPILFTICAVTTGFCHFTQETRSILLHRFCQFIVPIWIYDRSMRWRLFSAPVEMRTFDLGRPEPKPSVSGAVLGLAILDHVDRMGRRQISKHRLGKPGADHRQPDIGFLVEAVPTRRRY